MWWAGAGRGRPSKLAGAGPTTMPPRVGPGRGSGAFLVHTAMLQLLYHLDTYTTLASLLDNVACDDTAALLPHLAPLAARFPAYPCSAPLRSRLAHLVLRSWDAHAAYFAPPLLSWAEAWLAATLWGSVLMTSALLLSPVCRRSSRAQLAYIAATAAAELFLPVASLLAGTPPPSYLRQYLPDVPGFVAVGALMGVSGTGRLVCCSA